METLEGGSVWPRGHMYKAGTDCSSASIPMLSVAMSTMEQHIWERAPGEVWVYVVAIAIVYMLYILKDYLKIVKFIFTLSGPTVWPIIGNVHLTLDRSFLHYLSHTAYNDYGPVCRIWITVFPAVVLFEPADIQLILSSSKNSGKTFSYKLLHNFLGNGLITSDVVRWKAHRKILQPAFHLQNLNRFTKSFVECAEDFVRRLEASGQRNIKISKFINDAVINILNETVMGLTLVSRKEGKFNEEDSPFRKGQLLVTYRLMRPWLLFNPIFQRTHLGKAEKRQHELLIETCRNMIIEKREKMRMGESKVIGDEENFERKQSLLEFMVDVGARNPSFTEEEIINECCTFMLAGQDSVGTAVGMTLSLLARHQDWQKKCAEELERIFETDSRSPTMNDLKEMRCMEMCIKESMRLYPSVPFFARKLGEATKIGERVIPAGCDIFLIPYATHRLPHHFPDPHSFNPERFSPEISERRHPYAYLPFSAGPRNCIGYKFAMLEMKSLISAVLRKFHLTPVVGKEEIHPKFRLTLRAQGGLWVNLSHRSNLQAEPFGDM